MMMVRALVLGSAWPWGIPHNSIYTSGKMRQTKNQSLKGIGVVYLSALLATYLKQHNWHYQVHLPQVHRKHPIAELAYDSK